MIEPTIKQIISGLEPSMGDNLLGMMIDMTHYFDIPEGISFISKKENTDTSCMVEIKLEATNKAEHISDVMWALKQAWRDVSYSYFEASNITKYKKRMELRFVTVIDANAFFVTGRAVVIGKHYELLAKQYEQGFNTTLPE